MTDQTKEEYQHMLDAGMEPMTVAELVERLADLGYSINRGDSFSYTNTLNPPRAWKARSVDLRDDRTGLSFANVDANRDNLPALQELRRNAAVLHRGRIWEI